MSMVKKEMYIVIFSTFQ